MAGWEWYKQEGWLKVYAPLQEVDPDSHIIATYRVMPKEGMSVLDAGVQIAAEESVGTWTTVKATERVLGLAAKVVRVKEAEGLVWVAFPLDLFDVESGIPNLLSIVAGNLFGLSALRRVRLLDLHIPRAYAGAFRGPKFGIDGVRSMLGTDANPRPHLGTIVKPKVGLSPEETAEVAYRAARGGVDMVKDDETLTNQRFCPLEERVVRVMEALDRAREETGRRVLYAVNVTAHYPVMFRLAETALDHGANCLMVDVLTAGFTALQALAEDPSIKVPVHVHRAMHAAMTRVREHGIHMMVLAKLVRLAGGDQLHTGTAAGKMERDVRDVRAINDFLRGEWHGLARVMPVASGGIHPALVPRNLELLGVPDVQINAGGGIHGHPWGTEAGARAMAQAIEAFMRGVSLEEYARDHPELAEALRYWGRVYLEG